MSRHIEARFEIGSWDETPFEGGDDSTRLAEVAGTGKFRADPAGAVTLDLDGAW